MRFQEESASVKKWSVCTEEFMAAAGLSTWAQLKIVNMTEFYP